MKRDMEIINPVNTNMFGKPLQKYIRGQSNFIKRIRTITLVFILLLSVGFALEQLPAFLTAS